MFKIHNPDQHDIVIIEAKGKITKQDYIETLAPFLNKIKDEDKQIKLLFHAGSDFDGYSIGAALEDFKLSIHHFHTFEKCAIVTDISWIRNSCKFFGSLIPCPVKIFDDQDFSKAKKWLAATQTTLNCILDKKDSILIVEIKDSLSSEDFKVLSKVVDPWIKENGTLKGIILHVKKFPYWENIGGFCSHISFVKSHHREIKKVALVADGIIPNLAPKLIGHFVKAEVKNFDYKQLETAKKWVLSQT
jgi:hypothetical protein